MPDHAMLDTPDSNAMAAFLSRYAEGTRHELAASDSETWRIRDLLGLASDEQRERWDAMALGYSSPEGAAYLREAIACTYRGVRAESIIVTQGAQDALSLVFEALLQPGDHAILILPTYPNTEHAMRVRCDVSAVLLDAAQGWALDLDAVEAEIGPNTRMIVANFPNNPTGALLAPSNFTELVTLCRQYDLVLVNDEVYRLIDRNPHRRLPCVAEAYERGISIDAVSKSLGLPGLRIGWMATHDKAIRAAIMRVLHWRSSCPAAPSEVLADIALGCRDLLLARNRAIAMANLAAADVFLARHPDRFSWTRPEGSVVGYVRYHGTDGVEEYAARLACERGTLIFPASLWRSNLASLPEGYFRLGFGRRGFEAVLSALAS